MAAPDFISNPSGHALWCALWSAPNGEVLWDQARGELLGYANNLEAGGATITAEQIRMAVYGADEHASACGLMGDGL